jgi:FkbM family methyltransferase
MRRSEWLVAVARRWPGPWRVGLWLMARHRWRLPARYEWVRDALEHAIGPRGGYATWVPEVELYAPRFVVPATRMWEPVTSARFLGALATARRVVDVGAHIGLYTIAAARRLPPDGHVYAIEPDPVSVLLLRRNIRAHRLRNVTVHPWAAGAKPGPRTLYLTEHPTLAGMLSGFYVQPDATATHPVQIAVERLDDHIAAPVDLVKIDVEGAELEALEGMEGLLRESPRVQVCIEYNPDVWRRAGYDREALLPFLRACGLTRTTILDEDGGVAFPVEAVTTWPERAWWNLWTEKPA